jgi:tetratricopeptide (TPR) repeat protein
MSEENKIRAVVAGVLVAGAGALAVMVWLSSDEPTGLQPKPAIEAIPASFEMDQEPFIPPPEVAPEASAAIEPIFVVQPGEDCARRGVETFEGREFDKAAAYFRAEVETHPDRAWPRYMLGLSLWKGGRLEEAAGEMRRAAEIEVGSIRTLVNLSRIENDRGEFQSALDAARAALAIDSADATALFLEGRSLRNLGRLDEALQSLGRSVEIDPESGYARNLYGLTLLESGRGTEAVEMLTVAAGIEPGVAYIHNNLGMALERDGRRAEALEAYGRAVALDAHHARAAANLARLQPLVTVESGSAVAASGDGTGDVQVAETQVDAPSVP